MNPLPSGSLRGKRKRRPALWGYQARCIPPPTRGHFLSGTEREGRGGTDVLIPQPYNECQWPTESLIVLQDLQAVAGSRVTLGLEHAKVSCPGSPGMGRDAAFSGKGSTAGLTMATSHHLPPGITFPTNFFLQATGLRQDRKNQ